MGQKCGACDWLILPNVIDRHHYALLRTRFQCGHLLERTMLVAFTNLALCIGGGRASRTFRHTLGGDEDGSGRAAVNPQAFRTEASGCQPCSR